MRVARLENAVVGAMAERKRIEETSSLKGSAVFENQLGHISLSFGQFEEAAGHFRRVPEDERFGLQGLALLAVLRNDLAGLKKAFQPLRKVEMSSFANATVLKRIGLLPEARAMAERLVLQAYSLGKVVLADVALAEGKPGAVAELEAELVKNHVHASAFMAAESLASAYEQRNDLGNAIRVLERMSPRRAAMWGPRGLDGTAFWMWSQARLAKLYRKAGRTIDAKKVEDELQILLTYADADHPIRRQLAGK